MLFQEHMLKFSACYEFVPGYYPIPLDYDSVLTEYRINGHGLWTIDGLTNQIHIFFTVICLNPEGGQWTFFNFN